ncbi:hypothetical protein H2200_005971 [Cladophialophora chaetospira]|uniref:Uncharacterized protein n=1 Tax=Cladophialophora chaetospira TaxID=386627 RepID=A0AA39CI39_9EURO|nr:hypothetical protein H2200_005971 [Cladophialophora chaetospira]
MSAPPASSDTPVGRDNDTIFVNPKRPIASTVFEAEKARMDKALAEATGSEDVPMFETEGQNHIEALRAELQSCFDACRIQDGPIEPSKVHAFFETNKRLTFCLDQFPKYLAEARKGCEKPPEKLEQSSVAEAEHIADKEAPESP